MPDSITRHGSFASLYDLGMLNDWFYRPARRRTVDLLQLEEGDTVLDLFCGTGLNLPLLSERIGASGHIICVDGSQRMLNQARDRVRPADSSPLAPRTTFVQANFQTASGIQSTTEVLHRTGAHHVLFTLGLTCLPTWRSFFDAVFDAAPSGAYVSIMDVYNETLSPGARLMNWIAYSDTRRPVWKGLEQRGADVHIERQPYRILPALLGLSLIIAAGRKP